MRRFAVAALIAALVFPLAPAHAGCGQWVCPHPSTDWSTYGHDLQHTFSGRTSLNAVKAQTLAPAWYFRTGDAVSANPIEVGGTVYVGSWDGCFYAIDASNGTQRWAFAADLDQPAIAPQPSSQKQLPTQMGECPRRVDRSPTDVISDGGYITDSAVFSPAHGAFPDLVIFASGYTMYALRAATGIPLWKQKYPGTGWGGAQLTEDNSRIFSSPAVVGNHVLFSVDPDGTDGFKGYLVSADLLTGAPQWTRELDPGSTRGCGNVWGSPTIVERAHDTVEVVGVADCHFTAPAPYNERVLAVNVDNGNVEWAFTPPRGDDPNCDYDFGATANYGKAADGSEFLGIAGKDGTYYRLDPATGAQVWNTNAVFGGYSGGFIGTTAFDGKRAYGATALGDFGRFEGTGAIGCDTGNPNDLLVQEPTMFAFDGVSGSIKWSTVDSHSFGPTTVAGGMTFVGNGITPRLDIRDAGTGLLVRAIPLPAGSNSGTVVAGDALFLGIGTSEEGTPAGVMALTPLGTRPEL